MRVEPYVAPANWEYNREVKGSMSQIEVMMHNIMERFHLKNENVKEISNDLSGIGKKVDAHAVSIKKLEQQFNQLSTIVKSR